MLIKRRSREESLAGENATSYRLICLESHDGIIASQLKIGIDNRHVLTPFPVVVSASILFI